MWVTVDVYLWVLTGHGPKIPLQNPNSPVLRSLRLEVWNLGRPGLPRWPCSSVRPLAGPLQSRNPVRASSFSVHAHTYTDMYSEGVSDFMKIKHEQMFILIWAPLTKAKGISRFESRLSLKPSHLAQGQLTLSRSKASETSSMPEEWMLFLRMISAV